MPAIGIRLGVAAIEGMRDAVSNSKTAQDSQNLILRLAHMEYDRKLGIAGQATLSDEELEHFFPIQTRHMMIETDLPDRDKFGVMPEAVERIVKIDQCGVAKTFDIHRMNAKSKEHLGFAIGQQCDAIKVLGRHCRDNNR